MTIIKQIIYNLKKNILEVILYILYIPLFINQEVFRFKQDFND